MTKDEALKMCLEYIETDAHERKYVRHAIKEALAQPEHMGFMDSKLNPTQRTWVGLTSADWNDFNAVKSNDPQYVAAWAEAKLKEKNT